MDRPLKAPKYTKQVEVPTTNLYLPEIIDTVACTYHAALRGVPCHEFEAAEASEVTKNPRTYRGICNARALRAGMVGEIHPSSLDGRPQQSKR